jgi:hypothetical protein
VLAAALDTRWTRALCRALEEAIASMAEIMSHRVRIKFTECGLVTTLAEADVKISMWMGGAVIC